MGFFKDIAGHWKAYAIMIGALTVVAVLTEIIGEGNIAAIIGIIVFVAVGAYFPLRYYGVFKKKS